MKRLFIFLLYVLGTLTVIDGSGDVHFYSTHGDFQNNRTTAVIELTEPSAPVFVTPQGDDSGVIIDGDGGVQFYDFDRDFR